MCVVVMWSVSVRLLVLRLEVQRPDAGGSRMIKAGFSEPLCG
jgi:hypothetical protein